MSTAPINHHALSAQDNVVEEVVKDEKLIGGSGWHELRLSHANRP